MEQVKRWRPINELLEAEVWEDVTGYTGRYQISSFSRLRSIPRRVNTGGGGYRVLQEKIMKPTIGEKNQVWFRLHNGIRYKTELLHRLLAIEFIPNPENKATINHKDGNRLNNRLDNLEWNTYSENNKHACDTGLNNPIVNLPDNRRAVLMLDRKTGDVIMAFTSISEAARHCRGYVYAIQNVCAGKKFFKSAYGYRWAYKK